MTKDDEFYIDYDDEFYIDYCETNDCSCYECPYMYECPIREELISE